MSQKRWKKVRRQVTVAVENKIGVVRENLSLLAIIRQNWLYLVFLLIMSVGIYSNGMAANFVSDDYASITQNARINDIRLPLEEMSLTSMSTYIIAGIFGINNTVPFHLLNLGLFLLTIVIMFVVVLLLYDKTMAIFSSMIFATMPIHVESVTWISGKPYLFNGFFVLVSFLLLILYMLGRKRETLWLFVISLPLAFLADKIRFFSLFLIVGVLWLSFPKYRVKFNPKWLVGILVAVVLAIIYLIPKIMERVNGVNSGYNASESIFYNPFFQYPTGLAKYFQLLWIPIDLTLYHTMFVFPIWLNWVILLTYLTAIIYFFFKDRRYFFALSFTIAGVLPSMAPVKVSWLVAERYMFLGSVGFAVLLALIMTDIGKRYLALAVSLLALVVTFGGIRIYLRNIDWQTNHNLWVNTCQVSPNSHNAWNNIGDDYDKLKDYENAIKGFTQSTVVKPNYADAYHNRANILFKIGRLDLARDSYNTALYYSPGLFQTYISLTQIDLIEKKIDLALGHARKSAELQPNNPQALFVLAAVYAQGGMKNDAIDLLKKVLTVYPNYQPARQMIDSLVLEK